jgi:hypothetical protein
MVFADMENAGLRVETPNLLSSYHISLRHPSKPEFRQNLKNALIYSWTYSPAHRIVSVAQGIDVKLHQLIDYATRSIASIALLASTAMYSIPACSEGLFDQGGIAPAHPCSELPRNFSGRTSCTDVDGALYAGEVDADKLTGHGAKTWPNGDRYEGLFVDGKPDGNGSYTWKSGDHYSGAWADGMPNGKGAFTAADGSRYIGDFVDGQKSGKGIFVWPNGIRYVGDVIGNKRTGKGVLKLANGDIYEGDFIDGHSTGKGILTFVNGDRYAGEFVDGKRTGKGVL